MGPEVYAERDYDVRICGGGRERTGSMKVTWTRVQASAGTVDTPCKGGEVRGRTILASLCLAAIHYPLHCGTVGVRPPFCGVGVGVGVYQRPLQRILTSVISRQHWLRHSPPAGTPSIAYRTARHCREPLQHLLCSPLRAYNAALPDPPRPANLRLASLGRELSVAILGTLLP